MGRLGFPNLIRHQMEIPELQQLLKEYERARHEAGFSGPNEVCAAGTTAGFVAVACACTAPLNANWAAAIVRAAVPKKRRRSWSIASEWESFMSVGPSCLGDLYEYCITPSSTLP